MKKNKDTVLYVIFGLLLLLLLFSPWAMIEGASYPEPVNPLSFLASQDNLHIISNLVSFIYFVIFFILLIAPIIFMGILIFSCFLIAVDDYSGRENGIVAGIYGILSVGIFWISVNFPREELPEDVTFTSTLPLICGLGLSLIFLGFRERKGRKMRENEDWKDS